MSIFNDVYLNDLNFDVNSKGDLDSISGISNVKKSLYRRLLTVYGSMINRPDYGVGIKRFLGSLNSMSVKRQLSLEIQEQFEKDDRVLKVLGIQIKDNQNNSSMIEISCRVLLVGDVEENFKFEIPG